MRLSSILFACSFTLVAATGWVRLEAGPGDDGPAALPASRELTIAGQPVRVHLDRDRVAAGSAVTLTVAAVQGAAVGREVPVRLLAQTSSPMSRVPTPPRELAHTTVRLGAQPVTLPLTLPGRAVSREVDRLAVAGQISQYTVVVGEREAEVALPAFAYQPEAYRLAIEPPAGGRVGEPLDVTVRVTSVATAPLRGVTIRVSGSLFESPDVARLATLAPGATASVTLHGTRGDTSAGEATLAAFGAAERGGTAALWTRLDRGTGTLAVVPPPYDLLAGLY